MIALCPARRVSDDMKTYHFQLATALRRLGSVDEIRERDTMNSP